MFHFGYVIKQLPLIILRQPNPNAGEIINTVEQISGAKHNQKNTWVKFKHCHDAHYCHGSINQNPDNRIRVVELQKSKYNKHDGQYKIKNSHSITLYIT